MRKIDLTVAREESNIGSVSSKNADRDKALKVLEKAKSLNRPVIRVDKGAGEYSRNLEAMKKEVGDMLSSKDAAKYLDMSYDTFARRKKAIPSVKRGLYNFFEISDLDKYKSHVQ